MIARPSYPRAQLVEYPSSIEYPSSDGEPVAETDLHFDELADFRALLKQRYRDVPNAYAAGNMLVYYEEGNPAARFSPDVFAVFGVPKRTRRVYKIWEEGRAPAFVLEVSSRGTWLEDAGNKKTLCARLGVAEYFLFDPENDYLEPPLQGHRLESGEYRRIAAEPEGALRSEVLGLVLRAERLPDRLRLQAFDAVTGERLLRVEEWPDAAKAEAARAEAAEARAEAAEAELERLRRLLAERGGG